MKYRYLITVLAWQNFIANFAWLVAHNAKDFDDTVLYRMDFEVPDFVKNPELKEHVRTFYTHQHEKYECVVPNVQVSKEEEANDSGNINPLLLIAPFFAKSSCSYRIEGYWSYEICHGHHVRQYHAEHKGKEVLFEEYYLGKITEEQLNDLKKEWSENKAKRKYKTIKIENINYPYFEMIMSDGTTCDIISAPRTTVVRYVCHPQGKNYIYSFKETSSCNYEAIILTSSLCGFTAFHPEEYKQVPIKCYNSPTEPNKPISMLRQELIDMQIILEDVSNVIKEYGVAESLTQTADDNKRFAFANLDEDVGKSVLSLTKESGVLKAAERNSEETNVSKQPPISTVVSDVSPFLEFIKEKSCLTGGSGWWKFEFCYGSYVRQFHKDKKSETELFLGYFDTQAHRQWLQANPDKRPQEQSSSIWHHYGKGTKCDRTGLPREVDVKLSCIGSGSMNPSGVSVYLLEPKTCQYILVFESPMVCKLMEYTDDYGLINEDSLQKALQEKHLT